MRWGAALAALGLAWLGAAAVGRSQGVRAGTARNPYANPLLVPALAQRPVDPSVSLLYLLSANDAAGGIGSGRLSGVRPGPSSASRPAAEMPRAMATPGAGAARYFIRGASRSNRTGRPTGFQRHNRYFGQNGR